MGASAPTLLWVLGGGVGGWLLLAVGRRQSARTARALWAAGLVVAALLHVVFAVGDGPGALGLQVVGVLVFAAMARVGMSGRLGWLAAGWLLHPVWDLGLGGASPAWYVAACLGLDVVVGAGIYLRAVRR